MSATKKEIDWTPVLARQSPPADMLARFLAKRDCAVAIAGVSGTMWVPVDNRHVMTGAPYPAAVVEELIQANVLRQTSAYRWWLRPSVRAAITSP